MLRTVGSPASGVQGVLRHFPCLDRRNLIGQAAQFSRIIGDSPMKASPTPQYDYFIAHAADDLPVADSLARLLSTQARVFLDSWMDPGGAWRQDIIDALASSRVLIILLSSKRGVYFDDECHRAIELWRRSPERYTIVPVYLEPADRLGGSDYGLRGFGAFFMEKVGGVEALANKLHAMSLRLTPPLRAGANSTGSDSQAKVASIPKSGRPGGNGKSSTYRVQFIARFDMHEPPTFDRKYQLETLYVRPTLREQPLTRNAPAPFRTIYQYDDHADTEPRSPQARNQGSFIKLGDLRKRRRAIVLGSPGSGKSLLCKFMALQLAKHGGGRLPVFIRVRDLLPDEWSAGMSIADFLVAHLRNRECFDEEALDELRAGTHARRVTVFLDGLDEAGPELRPTLLRLLDALYTNPPGTVVSTARSSGFLRGREFGDAVIVSLEGLNSSGGAQLARTLLGDKFAEFHQMLLQRPESEELIRSPLLLTLMTSLFFFRGSHGMPVRRSALYRELLTELVERWLERDGKRSVEASDDPGLIRAWLRRLAHRTHVSQVEQFTKEEARLAWREAGGHGDITSRLRLSGILDAAGEDRFQCVHRSFRELLTAERLLELGDSGLDTMKAAPWSPLWENVVLLAAGLTADDASLREFPVSSERLIEAVRSGRETVVHHRLITVGKLLHELGPEKTLSPTLAEIRQETDRQLLELLEDPVNILSYGIRVAEAGGSTVVDHFRRELEGDYPLADLYYLGHCREVPRDVTERAIEWLDHPDSLFRASAIEFLQTRTESTAPPTAQPALKSTGTGVSDIVKRVGWMLDDPAGDVRVAALDFLASRADVPPQAVEHALERITDKDDDVRFSASLFIESRRVLPDRLLRKILELVVNGQGDLNDEAVDALAELVPLPTWSLHVLVDWLEYGDAARQENAVGLLLEHQELPSEILHRLVKLLTHAGALQREYGAGLLGELETLPESVVEDLFGIIEASSAPPESKQWALKVLGKYDFLSDTDQSRLVMPLSSSDASLRMRAAQLIKTRSDVSPPMFTQIARLLINDPTPTTRIAALSAISGRTLPGWLLVEVEGMLTEPSPALRVLILQVLGENGIWSADFEAIVLFLLKETSPIVRSAAARMLGSCAHLSAPLLSKLEALLEDPKVVVRIAALTALVHRSPIPESVKTLHRRPVNSRTLREVVSIPANATAPKQLNPDSVRMAAALQWTIAGWRGIASMEHDVRPRLTKLLACHEAEAALIFMEAITRFRHPDMPAAFVAIGEQYPDTLHSVIGWLQEYDILPDSVILWIVNALRHTDADVREAASRLLIGRETLSESALHALLDCLSNSDSNVRDEALYILRMREPLDEENLDHLASMLADEREDVRKAAISLLSNQPRLNNTALTAILRALGDQAYDVRKLAIEFPWARHLSKPILYVFVRMLSTDFAERRAAAVEVLWTLDQCPTAST